MYFEIDSSNGVPVWEQVYRQVAFAISNGIISPGELVPSVRSLARDLAINPNTVARAYRDLQTEGVVEVVRGSGMIVTKAAKTKCKSIRAALFKQQMSVMVSEARRSQLSDDEIRQLLENQLKKNRKK